jgi:DNA-binding MarR family transcriptional regulator
VTDDPLEDDLGWMLGVLFRAYVKAADHVMEDVPGGPRGYQVLTAAVHDPARNQGAITKDLGVDRTVLTYLIDDLERAGLVLRRPDPADRRSRLVVATDHGREVWRQRQQALRHVEAHLLGSLAPTDGETLRGLLREAACAAQSRDPVGDMCQLVTETDRHTKTARAGAGAAGAGAGTAGAGAGTAGAGAGTARAGAGAEGAGVGTQRAVGGAERAGSGAERAGVEGVEPAKRISA